MYKVSKSCQINTLNDIYTKYFGYPSKGYFVEVGAYDSNGRTSKKIVIEYEVLQSPREHISYG